MERKLLSTVLIVMVVLFFAVSSPVYAGKVRGVSDDTIKVGLLAALTGPAASVQLPHVEGMRNYTRYINDQGGNNGRKVKLLIEDDRYSIPASMAAFKKVVFKDGVLSIVGIGGTPQIVALTPQIEKNKVPVLSLGMSDKIITPYRRYIFNTGASYRDSIKVIFSYIINVLKEKDPLIGYVGPDTEFGKVGWDVVKEQVKFYGLRKAVKEVLGNGAVDASTQVLRLKRSKADYVIIQEIIPPTVALVRDSKKYRYTPTFFGTYFACSEDIPRIAGTAAKKFMGVHSFSSWYDEGPGIAEMRGITLKYHPGSEKPYRTKNYTQGWTTGLILAEGLKRSGKNLTNETLVDALETFKNFSTRGLCGTISYSSKSHKAGNSCKIYKADIKNGILVPISDWIKPPEEK